jgi:hypothetical protein
VNTPRVAVEGMGFYELLGSRQAGYFGGEEVC